MSTMREQKGVSLIEVAISLAVLGVLAVGILGALGTAATTVFLTDERQTAKNIAESQMEHVKLQPFSTSYEIAEIPAEYPNYNAKIFVDAIPGRDINIQKITVVIEHWDREVLTLEGYKYR